MRGRCCWTRYRISRAGSTLCVACTTTAPRQQEGGITFVHLNDTYRVGTVEDGKRGGFSRIVTRVRELQAEGRDVRLLHGGDFLYPSLESQLWDGLQMVDAMNFVNAVAPLYVTSGNHEFDRACGGGLVPGSALLIGGDPGVVAEPFRPLDRRVERQVTGQMRR